MVRSVDCEISSSKAPNVAPSCQSKPFRAPANRVGYFVILLGFIALFLFLVNTAFESQGWRSLNTDETNQVTHFIQVDGLMAGKDRLLDGTGGPEAASSGRVGDGGDTKNQSDTTLFYHIWLKDFTDVGDNAIIGDQ
eukprot:162337-Amorphochlora_amoeboformis.AAC.1